MSLESPITNEDQTEKRPSVEADGSEEKIISEAIIKISRLYVEHAKKYLVNDPELKNAVIDFYNDSSRLSNELRNVFAGKSGSEINEYVDSVENICADKDSFINFTERYIESFQNTTERANSFRRRDKRILDNPVATMEEYELGAFKDSLENQVADAVFELHDKGYSPFESGMTEDHASKDQFIGFYDKEVSLPAALVDELDQQGIEVSIRKLDDRTQILLHPKKDEKIRLSEWKAVWDFLAENMPSKERGASGDRKVYGYHRDFREFQDNL